MDPAATFLHRQERKAIERRRKREPVLALAPAYHEGQLGLLAITPARVLFASRRWLRTPVQAWPRRSFSRAKMETVRYGVLHLAYDGGTRAFELTNTGHKEPLMTALLGPRPKVDPIKALTRTTKQRTPRRPSAPAVDPLAHRQTPEHAAKMADLVARGIMTQQELDWQMGKVRR